ncbi:hypothetical protein [Parapedobacter indicus]|uniref:DUF3037 domain-containing protein n=1 Tax=Parapedobacter indicus TaxID=1477437 RepID=A0A1I3VQN6_9SPHI|nr:hypothetical protein [Parapedobacter indicus]PPK98236.1 hypothetical protein CLV26_1184 [Parapedobacter indicus]SFJ96577.1 hypothetical protein SAMN05444682_11827 [Parapedobacter indicus]
MMKTFYSILYCSIRPNQDERITIGLFMADGVQCHFAYAADKLNVIKDLLPEGGYQLIKSNLRAIEQLATSCQSDLLKGHKGQRFLSESYLEYLSVYANNLLTFSKPVPLNMALDEHTFDKLFEKFVFALTGQQQSGQDPVAHAKQRLVKSIGDRVNFDVELTENDVAGLIVPSKVSFIGRNDVKVVGEMSDFGKALHALKLQIRAHLFLVDTIRRQEKDAKFFFVGDEPSKKLKDHHDIWESLKNYRPIQWVPTDEVQQIEEYMANHDVSPFFERV